MDAPPLSRDLKDTDDDRALPVTTLTPSVDRRLNRNDRFPECHQPAVRLPESFRGGCSFGASLALHPGPASLSRRFQLAVRGVCVRAPSNVKSANRLIS